MKKHFHHKSFAVSEVISTLLLLAISVIGASILAIFINNFFDAGLFSQTDLNNPQNLFLVGYDTRDGNNLFGIGAIDNNCSLVTTCTDISLNGGSEYIVVAIENRGNTSVHIKNIFINEIKHSWDSQTNLKNIDLLQPSSGKFSSIASLSELVQRSPDIQSGKIGYIVVKLDSDVGMLEDKSLVNLRVDEKGIDSQKFIIRIGAAT